jgi:hypothetical protein
MEIIVVVDANGSLLSTMKMRVVTTENREADSRWRPAGGETLSS